MIRSAPQIGRTLSLHFRIFSAINVSITLARFGERGTRTGREIVIIFNEYFSVAMRCDSYPQIEFENSYCAHVVFFFLSSITLIYSSVRILPWRNARF